MLTAENFEELEKRGFTVVDGVVSHDDCDRAIAKYQEWLSQFKEGTFPNAYNGLINRYNTGNLPVTWEMRLKTKKVFSQLWKTEKLLTSADAISIGRPPENGEESFEDPALYWLHTDQIATRVGLHAYQGALYLEEQCDDDWTFQVMEGSHKLMETFYKQYPDSAKKSEPQGHYDLEPEQVEFYKERNCELLRVAVPKGGMALWDSRLIHANARPLKGRKHPGRWRYCVFVSMTPAIWATEDDMQKHKQAYEQVQMTTHWSSRGVRPYHSSGPSNITCPTEIPDVAKTEEARKLSGVIPYDFADGLSNGGDYLPKWITLAEIEKWQRSTLQDAGP